MQLATIKFKPANKGPHVVCQHLGIEIGGKPVWTRHVTLNWDLDDVASADIDVLVQEVDLEGVLPNLFTTINGVRYRLVEE